MKACKLKWFLIERLSRAQLEDMVCEHDGCCHRVCVWAFVCARAPVCVCVCVRVCARVCL